MFHHLITKILAQVFGSTQIDLSAQSLLIWFRVQNSTSLSFDILCSSE